MVCCGMFQIIIDGIIYTWEDITCIDVSLKISQWCAKHLRVYVISIEEPQEEEDSNSFFQSRGVQSGYRFGLGSVFFGFRYFG
ncbi:unnamed protein product [Brassica napus]|uniref:(rape) hypothetical protein n=1 Tax=Brassica napus TaxID=3708 RepID=A0A816LMT9_BRANA|nr:unnamed protein product [Brassica napus]